ncbi:alpha/beta hydrolase-fold protein [Hymenobacter polaris]|uniref:alpha/beta hydrolase-fold protein n=1 Tax=Hymenobacter polaris TaxID=2682546 RepID=UPI001F50801F|nr:alpha/beta hydrolase-fold protein [Hymenobacter polaris]
MTQVRFQSPPSVVAVRHDEALFSVALGRVVRLAVVLPPGYSAQAAAPYPVLYLNDGQDLARLHLPAVLNRLYRRGEVPPFVLVAVHAADRLQEYGVAARPDYLGRGSRAGRYADFMLRELLPYVQAHYHASAEPAEAVVAGMSLGGLSAFDLAWHHPEAFGRAGAFSGSFWWRGRALSDGYTDADRLMHQLVRARPAQPGQQFWLQTGTLDETSDRNHNGVIDAIDDTLDLLAELRGQGVPAAALRYVEVPGGHHHPSTWGAIMPDFLRWAFGQPAALGPAEVAACVRPPYQWRALGRALVRRPQGAARLKFAYLRPAATFAPVPHHPLAATQVRPTLDGYSPRVQAYINLVPAEADPLNQLRQQAAALQQQLASLSEAQALLRYAPGKWTPKQVLLHLVDAERIFTYRALRFARADAQELPGFDENDYADNCEANDRPLSDLLAEYQAVRAATLAFFGSLNGGQLDRAGRANGSPYTVRGLLYITAGHEHHHLRVLAERYWPLLQSPTAP